MTTVFDRLPDAAFWRPAVAESGPFHLTGLIQPKFAVTRDLAVATAGSCFAQHVGKALRTAGLSVLDMEPAPLGLDPATARDFGFGLYSARYGNIYTTGQLRQLVLDALSGQLRPEAVWHRNSRFFDALRPSVEPDGCVDLDELHQLRQFHLARVAQMFRSCQLFVFTLGMTESWVDARTGTVFPTAPGVIADPPAGQDVAFHNMTFAEILADLVEIRRLLKQINPEIRLLLTVSPVPLTATVSGRHVLAATSASKAILRAAVDEFARDLPDVDYMPSYEIITNPAAKGRFFAANLRSVTQEGVDLVMAQFLAAHGLAALPEPPAPDPSATSATEEEADALVCEEALAEAFRK